MSVRYSLRRPLNYVPFVCPNNTADCDRDAWIDRETAAKPVKERVEAARACNSCRLARYRRVCPEDRVDEFLRGAA